MEIPGFSKYTIDLDGNIWNKYYKSFMKTYPNNNYEQVRLIGDDKKKRKTFLVHRLVGLTFIPNPENKPHIDHIDRNPSNNNYLNLRWATPAENSMNQGVRKTSTSGYKNIYILFVKRDNKKVFSIQIRRLGKLIFCKKYCMKKYTLEEVVEIRNQIYKEFNIEIRD